MSPRGVRRKSIRCWRCAMSEDRLFVRLRCVAMTRLGRDLRYAPRNLLARPAFALASILSLALGIGACAAIFSIVDAVLLRPLPYPNAARVVELKEITARGTRMNFAEPNFADLRARNHSLEAMAQYNAANASTMLKTVTIVGASK